MKAILFLLLGVMTALFVAATVPGATYAADFRIENLTPSETPEVETGGGVTSWALMVSAGFIDDAGYVERLRPSESGEVEMGGGEIPSVLMAPTEFTNDAGYIERLRPAE